MHTFLDCSLKSMGSKQFIYTGTHPILRCLTLAEPFPAATAFMVIFLGSWFAVPENACLPWPFAPQNTGELLPAYSPPPPALLLHHVSAGPRFYTYIRGAWTREGEGAFNCHASLEAQLAVKNSIFGNVASLLGWWLVCFDTW